ncbi:MAG TPA: MG2 domain-containing protein [Verrucomicrobiae bacterium]|nr:MG2 domain-containing protein [Verrucomicrobiae bacterium]
MNLTFGLIVILFALLGGDAHSLGDCDAAYDVTPGHAITFACATAGGGERLTAKLFRIATAAAVDAASNGVSRGIVPAGAKPLESVTLANLENADGAAVGLFHAPPPGYYIIAVSGPNLETRQIPVNVSSIGLVIIRGPRSLLYAPVEVHTGRVVQRGVSLFMLEGAKPVAVRRDAQGLFPIATLSSSTFAYARAADGSITFAKNDWYETAQLDNPAYVQTDRPIYRPGDTMHIRAILRSGNVGAYHIDRTPVRLDVTSGYPSRTIAHRVLVPDAFGTVATDVALPPDAMLGDYQIALDGRALASVSVQAYRKPEYVIDVTPPNQVFGGDTASFNVHVAYLFGAPAGGLALHYGGVIFGNYTPWYGPFQHLVEWNNQQENKALSGDLVTDPSGDATIRVPTDRTTFAAHLSLTVEARDESGRTAGVESAATIVPATFDIVLTPDRWIGEVGHTGAIAVATRTYDGTPRPSVHVHVAITESVWKNGQYDDIARGALNFTTDARGEAQFTWTPPHPGGYRFEATARDERGDDVVTYQYQWTPDSKGWWAPPVQEAQLIPEKTVFPAGVPAHVLLVFTHRVSDAIVVISTDRVAQTRVVHVNGLTADIAVQPPPGAQHVNVQAYVANTNDGVDDAQTSLSIDPGPTTLHVAVYASKARYAPGERAQMRVHVTDDRGLPVQANIGIGVVDAGIYAIAPDTSDPRAPFYDRTIWTRATPNWNHEEHYLIKTIASSESGVAQGVASDIYNVNQASQAAMPAMAVRKNFLDTAYWAPAVTTDARGNATVTFDWPDNLTTWTSTAVAFSRATQIGSVTEKTLVTKDFLVRLETPRFLRAGDRSTIVGIAHGTRAGTKVRMQLDAPAFGDPPQANGALATTLRASASWQLTAPGVGSALVTLRGTDGTHNDAMQTTLPLLAGTAMEHVRDAGTANAAVTAIPADLRSGQLAGDLQISFSPSLLAELAQTLRAFNVYPYYCTEQTGSNGLVAAAFLSAAAQQRGIAIPGDPKSVVVRARVRLDDLEHADGGWGWWNTDPTNVFMSAYAVWTLQAMQDASPDPQQLYRIARGVAWLKVALKSQDVSDPELALALYAISRAQPGAVPSDVLESLFDRIERANATTTALAGLAAQAVGRTDLAQRAIAHLRSTAVTNGGASFWRAGDWGYEWWSDPIAATSYAAMLFERTNDARDLQSALAFIREQRDGDWWYTTADTAAAATALAQAEAEVRAQPTHETVNVKVGDRIVGTVTIANMLPDASQTHVVVPAALMQSHQPVTLERSGTGALYWSSDFTRFVNGNATSVRDASDARLRGLAASPPELTVGRRYVVDHPGPWRVGDRVTVDLWISAAHGAQYVTLEDPFPAGTEYQPLQGEGAYASWSGTQFLDDRAAFFLYWLPPGTTEHLQYVLRASNAGTYAAPGPSAYASYGPPVQAIGSGESVVIQ